MKQFKKKNQKNLIFLKSNPKKKTLQNRTFRKKKKSEKKKSEKKSEKKNPKKNLKKNNK